MSWSFDDEVGWLSSSHDDDTIALAEALQDSNLVRQVHYFREIDSTSRWLGRLLESVKSSAGTEGILAVADFQTAGRGRFDRPWVAPRGKALLFSVSLKTPPRWASDDDHQASQFVSMAAPVSVAESLRVYAAVSATIKFPNDIILGRSKCAGILVEQCSSHHGVFVIGIGVNVNQTPEELPPATHLPATSLLKETGKEWNRWELLRTILRELERWWKSGDIAKLSAKMNELCMTVGRRVRVILESGALEGVALGISRAGGLLVRTDHGIVEEVLSGDIRELNAES